MIADLVAAEPVQEAASLTDNRRTDWLGQRVQLGQRLGKTVGHLNVSAGQFAKQFAVVIALHAERGAGGDHIDHQPQHAGTIWPAIHQVAKENGSAAGGMPPSARTEHVAQALQQSGGQLAQFVRVGP